MEISIYHMDGYMLAAIPAAVCLLQYLDGSIKKPGIAFPGACSSTGQIFE